MSWTQVDFSLVRYSPVEGTHYFYDPAHPSAIQFLLDGQWESWDVGWVKHNSKDPDIKRVAADAEAALIRTADPHYQPWPSTPPSRPEEAGPALSPLNLNSPLPSPLFADGTSTPTSPNEDYYMEFPSLDSPLATSRPPTLPGPSHTVAPVPTSAPQAATFSAPYEARPSPPPQNIDPALLPSGPAQLPQMMSPGAYLPPQSNETPYYAEAAPYPIAQPLPPPPILLSRNRETKILLSLDGDGIRGLSQVLLVESLANAICTKVGTHIDPYRIFDLIGGSSMGGLVAIMLGRLKMQVHSAREAYKYIGKEVFQNKRDFFSSFDPHAPPLTHDGKAVEDVIKSVVSRELRHPEELLYDGGEESADVFVVSTRIDIGTNKAALMRSYQTRRITGPELDGNMTAWQAMKATSVAPRYMQPRSGVNWRPVIEPGLVDHGTAKNNPIRDILYECRKLYRYTNDMMVIISIGSGSGLDVSRETAEMAKSVTDRQMEAQTITDKFEHDNEALMERGWMKYFRFNVDGLDNVPLEEWCHEDRVREKTLAYLEKPEVGQAFYACVDAVTAILVGTAR